MVQTWITSAPSRLSGRPSAQAHESDFAVRPRQVPKTSSRSSFARTGRVGRSVRWGVARAAPREVEEAVERAGGELREAVYKLADNLEDPVLREAVKEPVAFFGGLFAGALGLDLAEEPLKGWVQRTSQAAGVEAEELEAMASQGASEDSEDDIEITIE